MESSTAWSPCSKNATSIRPGLAIERHKQLVRVPNSRHFPFLSLDFSFAGVLFNLGMEYNRLKLNGGNMTAAMVAQACD